MLLIFSFEPTEVLSKKLQKDELYVSGDFIYLDKANNKVTVKYKNGLPSGKFLIEASDFNFKAEGIYDINADMWYGNIYITKGSTYLALKMFSSRVKIFSLLTMKYLRLVYNR